MSNLYFNIPELEIDYLDIQKQIDDKEGWLEITPKKWNLGYVQYYKAYEPDWLKDQLFPIWSYMGLLVAAQAGEYLPPHIDNGRSAGILIPCTDSYEENSLDFYDIPEWDGVCGNEHKFLEHTGKIVESVTYTNPILFKNVPHGVDNTKSSTDRINLSVCFLEPYSYEVLQDLHNKGLLIK